MNLTLPDPLVTPGPDYASINNVAFEAIDAHTHSSGDGVQIPAAGININDDLTFNGFNIYGVRTVRLETQAVTPTDPADLQIVYSKGGELVYRDALGNEVPITASGSVAGATGSITGLSAPASASYSSITKTFTFVFDSSKPARFTHADLKLYPYDGSTAYANAVTIKSPVAIGADYDFTLPAAVPTQDALLSMGTSGIVTTGAANGTAGAPSIAFASDLDTGFYRISGGNLGLSTNGTLRFDVSTTAVTSTLPVMAPDGVQTDPAYTFASDPDTGVYSGGANILAFTTGGTLRFNMTAQLNAASLGSQAAPTYTFSGDNDTGVYSPGADTLGFTTGGTNRFTIDGNQLKAINVGSAAAPTYTWSGDPDTGIYHPAANQVGIATLGTHRVLVSSGGIEWEGNGPVKWAVYDPGTNIGAGASITFTAPAGATKILSGVGVYLTGSSQSTIGATGSGATVTFEPGTSLTTIKITNNSGVTLGYRVILQYV
jgi:hypothetical protein